MVVELWSRGIPFLPLDHRLAPPERAALIDRAHPTAVLEADGELTVFAQPASIDRGIGVVVATSGTGGTPQLVELTRNAVAAAVRGVAALPGRRGRRPMGRVPVTRARRRAAGPPAEGAPRGRRSPCSIGSTRRGWRPSRAPGPPSRSSPRWSADSSKRGPTCRGSASSCWAGETCRPSCARPPRLVGRRPSRRTGSPRAAAGVVYDGVPFDGTEVRIGADDRIELRGPTIMEGYRHDPAATGADLHDRRLVPDRRRGRARRRAAASTSAGASTMRSAPAARPSGPTRSSARSSSTRRSATSRSPAVRIPSGVSRSWRSWCRRRSTTRRRSRSFGILRASASPGTRRRASWCSSPISRGPRAGRSGAPSSTERMERARVREGWSRALGHRFGHRGGGGRTRCSSPMSS